MSSRRYYDEREFLYTSESVSEGHPDKVCDQISDAILDEYLKRDHFSRVAVETLATTNLVVLAGEVRGAPEVYDMAEQIVRDVVRDIGYDQQGFSWKNLEVRNYIHGQSPDIARGVDNQGGETEGAGDQGIMFGYACSETDVLMPAPIYYSHLILRNIFAAIRSGELADLGPDAKSQITLRYKGNTPLCADTVVVSIQHKAGMTQDVVRQKILPYVEKSLPEGWMPDKDKLYVNPTGQFVIGGPDGDTGLTGRKIIVDTYGGAAPHGGGAFSGKDPTKVDRSAAYMARYLAKNVVAAGISKACTIQLCYAIGVAKPLALYVNTHGTSTLHEDEIVERITSQVNLTPWGIRQHLGLNAPIYRPTAAYGHFGRVPDSNGSFTWERTDLKLV